MDRQELIRSAVAFLNDPKTLSSPLPQRIQFLEAKGLSPQEIDFAFKQASAQPINSSAYAYPTAPGIIGSQNLSWDWRDYFVQITGIVSGTLVYGAATLFKKYLSPYLQPPTATAYEDDRNALNAQFDAAEALLKEIQAEAAAVKASVEEQNVKIEETTREVGEVVKEMREGEVKTRDELREIREEINTIRDMLPKMIERDKEHQNQTLAQLRTELASLKTLLSSRPQAQVPALPKPKIPQWQLAGNVSQNSSSSSIASIALSNGIESGAEARGEGSAVEGFSPRTAESTPIESTTPEGLTRSQSLDGGASSGQLAESALAHLRKSLATHRRAASSSRSNSPSSASPRPKLNLEDRLRAIASEGHARSPITPSESAKPAVFAALSSAPLSPRSVPLPDSPVIPQSTTMSGLEEETPIGPNEMPLSVSFPLTENLTVSEPEPSPEKPTSEFEESHAERQQDGDTIPQNSNIPEQPSQPVTELDVDSLQSRLKQVEQRFAEVSGSFKRLQAEKLAVDTVLKEFTDIHSISDVPGLRAHFQRAAATNQDSTGDVAGLQSKVDGYAHRLENIQENHNHELESQSEQITVLKGQLSEAETLLKASQNQSDHAESQTQEQKRAYAKLQAEVASLRTIAKDEEEKRTKAISLLKTVRQKLVKAEKEKEDAHKEIATLKEKERTEREKERAERERLAQDLEIARAQRDQTVALLKVQYEKEALAAKERYEKELATSRGQYEQEITAIRSAHFKELSARATQISSLEVSLNSMARDKDTLFDQLQLRQAEVESAQSHLESLQGQITELQYQLRERQDQIGLLTEDLGEARRQAANPGRDPAQVANDVARLVATAEAKYETKVVALKRNLSAVEKERNDVEAEWNRKLREKTKELEDANNLLASTAKMRQRHEETVTSLQSQIVSVQENALALQRTLQTLQQENRLLQEQRQAASITEQELKSQITGLEHQIEETKAHDTQLRASNKNLREELRKVQSSVALLDRQRNTGVGYWTSRHAHSESVPEARSPTPASESPARADTPNSANRDEEVNLEYLRNVILQFLEHKEMRPNLVRVLSTILHFTPQETRRLIAKV
ncbi:hypothetical protein BDN72DRAFT_866834 [Pluteus cervinus]|uniref:Uncharacterized protein n=1 Tax=Pluteus cervinus TaxID=181527 RepID=A0ACD3BGL3_9AGAR|nr:hypothetical protein BDN72DRAFT_866834 [Pluteus cervinus]